jgi:hypothetical protein
MMMMIIIIMNEKTLGIDTTNGTHTHTHTHKAVCGHEDVTVFMASRATHGQRSCGK